MQLKISCFNKTLFRKNLTRFWPLWGMASFVGALFPMVMFMELSRGTRLEPLEMTEMYYNVAVYAVPVLSLFYAVMCALAVWHYLYAPRSVGMMHTLPITRKGLFLTNFLSGMAMMLIPYAVTGALTILISLVYGFFEPAGILATIAAVVADSFFYFASATVVAFVTGNVFALPVLYFIFHFLAVIMDFMVSTFATGFLFGLNREYNGVVEFLSPTVYLMSTTEISTEYEQILDDKGNHIMSQLSSVTLENGWVIALYAAVGVVLALCAWMLYRRRRSESAGDGQHSMKGEVIRDICTDVYGNIWVGTEDAGINCLEKKTGTFTNYQPVPGGNGLSHTNIRGLAASGDRLWIGHVIHGIDLMDIKTRKVIKHYNLLKDSVTVKNSAIRCIKVSQEGQIYVGTDDGVYKYDFLNDRFLYAPQFPPFAVNCIYEDRLGRIWTGMFNRSFYYNPISNSGMYLPYDKLNTQRHNFVNDACEDKDGNMWFATVEGVIKYDFQTGESLHYTVKNGMPSNVAFRILRDENEHMWISTANGLVSLEPGTGKITTYTESHGLITRQFNDNSAFKDNEGTFYFGSVKGFIHFNPSEVIPTAEMMNVHLGSLEIQNEESEKRIINCSAESEPKKITLTHKQSTFSINFSALNFIAPKSIQYSYRMGNTEWIPIGERNTVYFTELHPGDYTFEVRAANLSNTWSDTPTRLNITVLPPWWASNTAYASYIGVILAIIAGSFWSWRLKTKRAMAYNMQLFEDQKEKELYQAKIDFFINIAHEIRTPLTLIKNPLERLLKSDKIGEKENKSLTLMDKNVSRLLSLVNQLLDFRKTEIEGYRLSFVRTEIVTLLTETAKRFQESATANGLLLNLDLSLSELYVFVDKEAITKIFSNLFSNAIKYAAGSIIVRLQLAPDYETFTIDFINDGKPIPAEIGEKIFEPFYRIAGDAGSKPGTGLGLPLARSLAEMHNGTLQLAKFADGPSMTMFRLTLPVKLPESIKQTEEEVTAQATPQRTDFIHDESRPTILIVEDNKEMATFIADEVNQLYNVTLAGNGAEAIGLLKKHSIQLIISDVMMPVMDGFALLKEVKTDIEFSHIPVILLTAKNTMQSRLEGLELGADAYLDKPFSTSLLMAQISNLISNRDNIRKFYFNSPIANMKSMAYTKADENFLEKLNEIINEHIGNPNLDVNMIADLMHLSRPTLYRKIRAISDLTPNELIKISRLKKAAELLIQGNMKIYEISEATGFSSQSYFWSAFIKQFGMSPSNYAKENK